MIERKSRAQVIEKGSLPLAFLKKANIPPRTLFLRCKILGTAVCPVNNPVNCRESRSVGQSESERRQSESEWGTEESVD